MTITAKFNGFCTACKGTITTGQLIVWAKGVGSAHASAADCAAAITQRRIEAQASAKTAPVVNLAPVVAFLAAARDGKNGGQPLKSPKTRFAAPGSGELTLSLAPLTGKNPGAVYVKLNGEYAGKVTAEGAAYGLSSELVDTLRAIAADPAAAGAAYGRLTGQCSFCTQGLTDEGSLDVGYGPKCAKNYGLPHKPRGSAKTTPVVLADALRACTGAVRVTVTDGEVIATSPIEGDCDGSAEWNVLAAREEAWRL
jgi:Family of unknown function (DUF6011)